MNKNYIVFVLTLFIFLTGCLPKKQRVLKTVDIDKLLAKAKPGQNIVLKSGFYTADIVVPSGISLRGENPRTTIIAGSVSLAGTPENSVDLSDLTLIHTGERSEPLVACRSGKIFISHTVLMSRGGFSTVSAMGNTRVVLKNNIIIGPQGGYAVFGRRQAKLEIINNTIVVYSFGVGLMDHSFAEIRNCLVCGNTRQPFTQINSDYTVSYTNISMGLDNKANSVKDPLQISDSSENNQEGLPRHPLVPKEVQRYAGNGVTFFPHHCLASQNIDEYQRHQPLFAVNAGCPSNADKNPDGSRNTLGAFGGPQGKW